MEKYLGVKLIEAELAYKHEDGSIEVKGNKRSFGKRIDVELGHKVRYEDGYESWCPKDVFEKAYRKIRITPKNVDYEKLEDHQIRVAGEMMELSKKVTKLHSFIYGQNKIFPTLDNDDQNRLKQQLMAMQYYLTILVERIENF